MISRGHLYESTGVLFMLDSVLADAYTKCTIIDSTLSVGMCDIDHYEKCW